MTRTFDGGAVSLSFDDGWRSQYDRGLPILEELGLKGTFYIISGHLDDEQFPRYVNLENVQELERRGHEIGCHTAGHKRLATEPRAIIEEEVFLSRRYLEKHAAPVATFAYPFGQHDARVLEIVKRAGFSGARGTQNGFNDGGTDLFQLRCKAVKVKTALSEMKGWVDAAREAGVWLILMFHQIDEEGRDDSSTPETLRGIGKYLADAGDLATLTVREGVAKLLADRAVV